MNNFLKALLLFAAVFATGYAARILIVPDVVPIVDAEQTGWPVQIAFVLTSIQNVGLFGMGLVMLVGSLKQLRSLVIR
jgi:hypothetical protein